MVIVGDVILDEGPGPMLVLAVEPKQTDNRRRFTLLLEDGTRIHRTYPNSRMVEVQPLGAGLALQRSFHLRASAGRLFEVQA